MTKKFKYKTPTPGDRVSFTVCKGDERYQRKISGIVQVVVATSYGTYFQVGDGNQYYVDAVEDFKIF